MKVHEDDKPYINERIKHLIRKRDKAYQSGRVEHYKTLRNLIVSEIRKSKRKFYNENIIGLRNENARKWWKNVKKIVGASSHNFTLGNAVSENMSNKQTADYINTFFISLTKDYPRINSEWLSFGSAEYLPKISVQSVARKLFHIDVNKAPGLFDPNLKLLKMSLNILQYHLLIYTINHLITRFSRKCGKSLILLVSRSYNHAPRSKT